MKFGLHSSGMLRGVTSQKSEGLNYARQKPENSQTWNYSQKVQTADVTSAGVK
jgi:hypothetical protein